MCDVSVIMPVYNSQKYLEKAIKSVLNQSFENIELILVDDGSTDKSGKICDHYAEKDTRVKVYHNQNQGICATRNFAIEKAVGTYILFIDNDDELAEGMIEENYQLAVDNQADVVKFSCAIDESYANGFVEKRGNYFSKKIIFTKEEASQYYLLLEKERYFSYIWTGMYRREFLVENNLLFDKAIKCGYEDRILNYQIYLKAQNQVINPSIGYKYYQRYEHSTFKKFNKNQLFSCLLSAEKEFEIYNEYKHEKAFNKEWIERAAEYLIELLFTFEKKGCHMTVKERKEYIQYLRRQDVFSDLQNKNKIDILDNKKRFVAKLFAEKKDVLLLFVCGIYSKFILYRKIVQSKKREDRDRI